jgi:hypothetical protein
VEEGEDYEAEIEMCVRFLRLIRYQCKGKRMGGWLTGIEI